MMHHWALTDLDNAFKQQNEICKEKTALAAHKWTLPDMYFDSKKSQCGSKQYLVLN